MKVVLDTNVLLVSIPRKSKYRPVFDSIFDGRIELLITNEIISEYFEIIAQKTNEIVSNNIIDALLTLPNVLKTEVYFKWRLITIDVDDNKFVDCYVGGNADLLVTNDHHFNVLKKLDFPKMEIVSIDEFLSFLNSL